MARIKDASVEAVKAATDIVALVEGYTRLRKSGSRYTGLCPFHQEKTPSFGVSPDRGTFKCFGCGEGGDAIAFVEKKENLDFVGAIEWLGRPVRRPARVRGDLARAGPRAQAARAALPAARPRGRRSTSGYLWESESGAFARDYLASRGLGEEVCREFRLGLAPGRRRARARGAASQGFTGDELAGAGLVNRRGNDYFSRRLLFPLADARGRVRGFQARQLYEDDPLRAKYVNSPEGDLFRKGDLLYGLDLARAAIAKQDRAVIVEGNPDAIALRQAGFEPAVAAMGTALTEAHLRELSRLTTQPLALLRRRRRRPGGDAARDGAGRRPGLRHPGRLAAGRAPTRPTTRPLRRARSTTAEDYLPYRVRVEIERLLPDRKRAFERVREILAPLPRLARAPGRRPPCRRPARAARRAAGGPRAGGARPGGAAVSPKVLEAGVRLERDALAGVVAHPSLVPVLAELTAGALRPRAAPPRARAPASPRRRPIASSSPSLAELDARAAEEAIDEATGTRSCCCGCASAASSASSTRLGRPRAHERAPARSSRRSARPIGSLS